VPVFYLLLEVAQVRFPLSRRSSPSEVIHISRKGDVLDEHHGEFPVVVSWDQWKEAVVPVLEDSNLQTRLPLCRRALETGRVDTWVELIGVRLRESFEAAGYTDG